MCYCEELEILSVIYVNIFCLANLHTVGQCTLDIQTKTQHFYVVGGGQRQTFSKVCLEAGNQSQTQTDQGHLR